MFELGNASRSAAAATDRAMRRGAAATRLSQGSVAELGDSLSTRGFALIALIYQRLRAEENA